MNIVLRKFFLLFCCLLPLCLAAQKKGYRINVQYDSQVNATVYLNRVTPLEIVCVDSAVVKKGKGVLKGSNDLEPGNYHISQRISSDNGYPLILGPSQRFSISFGLDDFSVSGSVENQLYLDFHNTALSGKLSENELHQYVENLTSVSPNSLSSKYMNFECDLLLRLDTAQTDESLSFRNIVRFMAKYQESCYMYNSFWCVIMNNLLREDLSLQDWDFFFQNFSPKGEVGQFYLKQLMLAYNTDGDMEADGKLLHLYDEFYQPNGLQLFGEDGERRLQKTIERKRRTQLGAEIPVLEVLSETGKKLSSNDIQRKYTVIWFWDPDCEDCQIETPQLHEFYLENADTYDFEVFAVSITEDVDFWKEKMNEWNLTWLNSCYGLGGYNYDFVDYLSLIATPVSFLLDENHRIVYRNFTPEQLKEFFENQYQYNE